MYTYVHMSRVITQHHRAHLVLGSASGCRTGDAERVGPHSPLHRNIAGSTDLNGTAKKGRRGGGRRVCPTTKYNRGQSGIGHAAEALPERNNRIYAPPPHFTKTKRYLSTSFRYIHTVEPTRGSFVPFRRETTSNAAEFCTFSIYIPKPQLKKELGNC